MVTAKKTLLYSFLILLISILTMVFLPSFVNASDDFPQFEEAVITGDEVNMRLRPSTDAPVVLKFTKDTRVGVFCEEEEGWYRIIYGNYRGYVSKDYVFLASTDSLVGNVLADNTQVFNNVGAYGDTVTKLTAGAGVSIIGSSGDYFQVEIDEDKSGYIKSDTVELTTLKNPVTLLKEGMEGTEVKKMQTKLKKRGFLAASATGYFGDKTADALKLFQKAAKLSQDGVAGEKTLELLYGDNDIKMTAANKAGIKGGVIRSNWNEIKNVFKRGTYATVTDVKSGIQYKVYRFGGWYHADCVLASKEDTAKMKKAAGGNWTWNRRAIWVTVGNKTYAASQNSMPHMVDANKNDNFKGHFCIHFYGSKVHENGKSCPRHQAMVQYAYNKGK